MKIDKNSRCAKDYNFGTDIPYIQFLEKIEAEMGVHLNLTTLVMPKFKEQFKPRLFIGLMSFQVLASAVILCFLISNSYYYGIKQKRFCHSPILTMFYVFSIPNMIIYMGIGGISIYQNFIGLQMFHYYDFDEVNSFTQYQRVQWFAEIVKCISEEKNNCAPGLDAPFWQTYTFQTVKTIIRLVKANDFLTTIEFSLVVNIGAVLMAGMGQLAVEMR